MQVTTNFEVPENLAPYFQAQITTGQYPTVRDYIQALVREDLTHKAELETKLLEALDSPATPMTPADWDHIRASVRQNLSQANPNA
jgi:Arc/MetJ-type ribon-helix-helix transcriptional regulator